jgi:phosphatidyl-myo-inositol dimannoside synthase
MTGRVLLLSPSRGLGGGVERYVATMEWAFAAEGVECQRLDLSGSGARAHARLLGQGRASLQEGSEPTRLVVAHRALLPVAALLARESVICGVSVVCHGSEVWGSRWRPRRILERHLMRGAGVRVVAVSNFTAGTLMRGCLATVLPPALSRLWLDTLAAAAASKPDRGPGIRLVTVFRLTQWRTKGLPQLMEAVMALGRQDIFLTICGSGNPSADLLRLVAAHSWCMLRTGLSDDDLARELAAADLFVLATQTKSGRGAVGEGFGLVLLEAQAAATPVVAPAYGGSREAYVEGVTGAAPTDESAEALTSTLHDLLKDPARLAWMGGCAAQWSRQAFAPEQYAQLAVKRLLLFMSLTKEVAVLAESRAAFIRKARYIGGTLLGNRKSPSRKLRGFDHWGAARLLGQPVVSGPVSRVRVSETAGLANVIINTVGGCVDIGDYVFFGHDVLVLTGTHDFTVKGLDRQAPSKERDRSITIENGAWIASRSVIIGPCIIGANAVIGCGCVIDFDVPADTVVRVRQEIFKDTIRYRDSSRLGQFMDGRSN